MPSTERTINQPPAHAAPGVTIGVVGGAWRADVTPWGALRGWPAGDGASVGSLDWWVAADDRWHDPAQEPTIRQSSVDGTPVVETRLRIPSGDAIQRVYAVADGGGHTVIEVENDSSLPIAVAFSGAALLSVRAPADMPLAGIDLPDGTVAFPVGHRSTFTVAISHQHPRVGRLPGPMPSYVQVARGWMALCDKASRLLLPDPAVVAGVVAARCDLLLAGPLSGDDHAVDFLLGVGQLVRMGTSADGWMAEVADAVSRLTDRRDDPLLGAALDAAEQVCIAACEPRAVRDLDRIRARLVPSIGLAATPGAVGARFVVQAERHVADGGDLFPLGLPSRWLGQNFEVHDVPTSPRSTVSLAVRWHGPRLAVLWECHGEPVLLRAPELAADWSSASPTGETLWPAPPGADAAPESLGSGASFS